MSEIQWEAPPDKVRNRHGDTAAALRERAGEWALIAEDTYPGFATKIKQGAACWAPAGSFEVRTKSLGVNRAKVWARYVGEASS